jgi:hypothetical protein
MRQDWGYDGSVFAGLTSETYFTLDCPRNARDRGRSMSKPRSGRGSVRPRISRHGLTEINVTRLALKVALDLQAAWRRSRKWKF